MISVNKVSQLSHRIFNTSVTETKVARDSNPFSESNFQKNILTEDVFESSKGKQNINFTGLNDKIAQNTKRIYALFAGSINNFSKRFYEGIESIREFYHNVKSTIVSSWNKMQELGKQEVDLREGLKQSYEGIKNVLTYDMGELINSRERQIAKMAKLDPHTQLKPMLIDSIEALAKEYVQAA